MIERSTDPVAASLAEMDARLMRAHPAPPRKPRGFTAHQLEILRRVALGESNKHIGKALRISPLSVKNHIAIILRKLDAPNRTIAAVRAVVNGLVAFDEAEARGR